MANTDWYNTNEHIQYPFCPYEEVVIDPETGEKELETSDVIDCQFFLYNAPSANTNNDSVWLHSKEIDDEQLVLTFKCADTTEEAFLPLVFRFEKSKDWQGKWVKNDDWYGFVAVGPSSYHF